MKRISLFLVTILSLILFTGNVNAKEVTIKSTMSQEEINVLVATLTSGDNLNVEAGNYAFKTSDGLTLNEEGQNYHKAVILTKDDVNVILAGSYTRFELVVRANNTTVSLTANTTLNGDAQASHNTAAAFAVQSGSLNIDTNDYTLYIKDYNNGIRMGYNNTSNSTTLNISEGSNVDIDTYYSSAKVALEEIYYDSYNDHGDAGICGYRNSSDLNTWYCDGAVGAGIYTRGFATHHIINVNTGAILNVHNSSNSGIYLGNDSNNNKVTINVNEATLNSNNNSRAGIFEDGSRSVFQVNATNSTINISKNNSNGITGHTLGGASDHNSLINISNTTLHIDNNKSIAANNVMFYITSGSYVTCNQDVALGELYGSHGFSNISLMIYDSKLEMHGNKYRGLNITTNHEGMPTTISNSTVSVTGSGQSGIYFLNQLGTIVENSNVTTNGNGITEPTSTFKGDGIVASYDVTFINSYLTSTDPHSIATSETKYSPSTVYIKEYTVAVSEGTGETDKDVVEDKCTSTEECKEYTGTIVITGGSFQASNDVTVENHETYVDNREDISSTIKVVNDKEEDLYRFTLHSNVNVEVGGDGNKEFTYDYKDEGTLTYKFIYDNAGMAYVWTPISILNYDSTEGLFINSTTALLLGNRFGKDITIYGNSLNLAEKTLSTASRDGYKFLGWFIADNQELAKEYAENEDWENLYELLNTPFTEETKLKVNESSVPELTVYAKWVKESKVVVSYITTEDETLHEDITMDGYVGEDYVTEEKSFDDYELVKVEGNKTGKFAEDTTHVVYIYEFFGGIGDGEVPEEPSNPEVPEIPQTGIGFNNIQYVLLINLVVGAIITLIIRKKYTI